MVDTNVVIDARERDGAWRDWSIASLTRAQLQGRVVASAIVIGEMAGRSGNLDEVEAFLGAIGVAIEPLSATGAFAAGLAQAAYRRNGGRRDHLLGDFLIGGHALALNATLVTRDARRYRRYFPDLPLITPETDDG